MSKGWSLPSKGPPRRCSGRASACHCRRLKRCRLNPWVGKICWRRKWQLAPVFLPRESHGQRSLVCPCGCRELGTAEWLSAARESTCLQRTHSSAMVMGKPTINTEMVKCRTGGKSGAGMRTGRCGRVRGGMWKEVFV